MAFALDEYTASPSQTDFTITFSYLQESHVLVYVDGTLKTQGASNDYTFFNATTIRFNSGLTGGELVIIQRATSQSTRLTDYTAGALTEADLDNDSTQAFYFNQEAIDIANRALGRTSDGANFDAESKKITNLATPTANTDAATKAYADTIVTSVTAQADAAAASAAAAANSESAAAASESAAAASESAAAASESAAAASESAAAASAASFTITNVSDQANTSTGWLDLPVGTTAQRGSPTSGAVRYNTDDSAFEGYDGSAWGALGGGNTTSNGLWENNATISSNYTITSGNNALSAGPLTINGGVTVTVPSGSTWVVV